MPPWNQVDQWRSEARRSASRGDRVASLRASYNFANRAGSLQGADLTGADLTGARLQGTQLQGANLSQAQLVGADLEHADLHRVTPKYGPE